MKKEAMGLALLVGSASVQAHEPVIPLLHCWSEAAEVACEARFSHGPAVPSARYEVTDAEDKTLLSGVTDRQGRLRFARPSTVFHVLLWDARNALAEASWQEVKESR